jgi:hypothetical protein
MSAVKGILQKVVPRKLWPGTVLKHWLDEKTANGSLVIGGPFKGIHLGDRSYYSPIYSKLLGAYEKELHDIVERAIALNPALIVEIGAAEGYYACGFAHRLDQDTQIIAYEADVHYRYYLRQNLCRNGFQNRVTLRGVCQVPDLRQDLHTSKTPIVIFCDAEGWEHELLDNDAIPELNKANILVELHDCYLPNLTEFLERRFMPTHKIVKISSIERTIKDLDLQDKGLALRFLPRSAVSRFLKERPSPQQWLWMEPLT